MSLHVGNNDIEQSDEAKYLGVIIDRHLTFESEVKAILMKMAVGIKTLYAVRDFLPRITRLALMRALVLQSSELLCETIKHIYRITGYARPPNQMGIESLLF